MSDALAVALVLVGLAGAGYAYDRWVVTPLETEHAGHPYTPFLVVAGTLMTLAGASVVIGLTSTLLVLACFGASGAMMVIGAARRYLVQRARERTANTLDVLDQLEELADEHKA